MTAFTEFYNYTENLIKAQYQVSEIIRHELTKGEVREEFVVEAIQKGFSNDIKLSRGFLQVGEEQSNQMDILLLKNRVHIANIGTQVIVNPEDCHLVIEVKGNALGRDFRDFNNKIERIKEMESDSIPLFGMFCYQIQLTERTIMNRFGFNYDTETDSFYDQFNQDENIPGLRLHYPNIDFLINVEVNEEGICKELYLRKNEATGRYIKSVEYPVMKNVFSLTRGILRVEG